jgi:hypothetical protein
MKPTGELVPNKKGLGDCSVGKGQKETRKQRAAGLRIYIIKKGVTDYYRRQRLKKDERHVSIVLQIS